MKDIRKIRTEELKLGNFAFMDLTGRDSKEWIGQPTLFDGVVFGFCLSGSFLFRISHREFRMTANEVFICLPRHLFTATGCSSDLSVKLLLVSPEYLYALPVSFGFDWLKHVEASPRLPLPAEKIADLTALYTLLERYDTDNKQAPPIRDALLLPFLLIIIAQVEPAATASGGSKVSRQEWLTRRFFELMSEHFESQRQVSFYADRLCITAKRLSAAVKETSRHTALEWLNEAALVEAKRCLRTTDLTVLQISEALHFSTASSFVRFFRQHAGCTPLEYRRR